jgi:hypothetical protein
MTVATDTLPSLLLWRMLCHRGFISYVGKQALMFLSFAGPVS